MIRLAKILEIPDILIITQTCAKNMIDHGIYQWNEYYPSKEAFEKDIAGFNGFCRGLCPKKRLYFRKA